jgi:hypothetical protein
MEQLGSHWTDLHEILYLSICRKSVEKIQVSLKSDKNNGYLTWRPTYLVHFLCLAQFFLEWKVFQTKVVEKIKTHVLYSTRESCRLWDNVKKYCRAGQATDDNMAHAHCMLDNYTYSQCVILNAFPVQQWLQERTLMLPCTYIACLF